MTDKQGCFKEHCPATATYWVYSGNSRKGYCFGHATAVTRLHGRRERKERP